MSSNQANPDDFLKLRPLPHGGTIGLISPSSPADPARLKRGIAYLENREYTVKLTHSLTARNAYLAGTGEDRAASFMELIYDPEVDAIFCSRGGFGSIMMLPHLDYPAITKARKLLLGFSDVTALQWAIWHHCRLPSISAGMVATDMANTEKNQQYEQYLWKLLETGQIEAPLDYTSGTDKTISGIIMPGTVSVAAMLLGSEFMPDLTGTIPIFEDVLEPTHKVEAYLQQFRLSGKLDNLNAVITGRYTPAKEEEYPEIPSFQTILDRVFGDKSYPVIQNFDYGHVPQKIALPLGVPVNLTLGQKSYLSTSKSIFES